MVEKYAIDYVLIDMNPSLSETNKNLLMISDYFIVPTAPDFFSQMALNTLSLTVPKWKRWALTARTFFKDSIYPFPEKDPKFLGIIMQNFTIRNGQPAKAFKNKIDGVLGKIKTTVIPAFEQQSLLLSDEKRKLQLERSYCIAHIPNFQSLAPKMQAGTGASTPVFAIDDKYLETGTVLKNYQEKRELFKTIFSDMTDLALVLMAN